MTAAFADLVGSVAAAVRSHYGDRLVSLAVFGSVGRGTARPDSDLDLLIVADGLAPGRSVRLAEFALVEKAAAAAFGVAREAGLQVECSPIFKTRKEAESGSPLFLDMTTDARILFDRDDFLQQRLRRLTTRLQELGARRIWRGNAWFWDLKPDYRPGEVFEL